MTQQPSSFKKKSFLDTNALFFRDKIILCIRHRDTADPQQKRQSKAELISNCSERCAPTKLLVVRVAVGSTTALCEYTTYFSYFGI